MRVLNFCWYLPLMYSTVNLEIRVIWNWSKLKTVALAASSESYCDAQIYIWHRWLPTGTWDLVYPSFCAGVHSDGWTSPVLRHVTTSLCWGLIGPTVCTTAWVAVRQCITRRMNYLLQAPQTSSSEYAALITRAKMARHRSANVLYAIDMYMYWYVQLCWPNHNKHDSASVTLSNADHSFPEWATSWRWLALGSRNPANQALTLVCCWWSRGRTLCPVNSTTLQPRQ